MLWKWVLISLSIILVYIGVSFYIPVHRLSISPTTLQNLNPTELMTEKVADTLPPLTTTQEIFNPTQKIVVTDELVTILVTGDVLTARSVNAKVTSIHDFTWPFQKTKELLQSADAAFINLETPIIKDCPTRTDGMFFCGSVQNMLGLQYAGIDVVTMANNHAGNQGPEGVIETEQTLKDAGFLVTGVHGPVYKKMKGSTFAFVGLNDVDRQVGISHADNEIIAAQIGEARKNADIVIVEFHWGEEYTYTPTERQKELARLAIDSGADLVVGNHPHWFQPQEFYKGKLIAYSHGNFIFDQMWSQETREGIVGKYIFQGKNLVEVEYIPILIENYGQPRILSGQEADKVLSKLQSETEKFAQNTQ